MSTLIYSEINQLEKIVTPKLRQMQLTVKFHSEEYAQLSEQVRAAEEMLQRAIDEKYDRATIQQMCELVQIAEAAQKLAHDDWEDAKRDLLVVWNCAVQ